MGRVCQQPLSDCKPSTLWSTQNTTHTVWIVIWSYMESNPEHYALSTVCLCTRLLKHTNTHMLAIWHKQRMCVLRTHTHTPCSYSPSHYRPSHYTLRELDYMCNSWTVFLRVPDGSGVKYPTWQSPIHYKGREFVVTCSVKWECYWWRGCVLTATTCSERGMLYLLC